MWYMAVDDQREFLVVSDRGDDNNHSVDLRHLITGQHLHTLAHSPYASHVKNPLIPTAYIKWPRGNCVDSLGRVFLIDEKASKPKQACRIQEFDLQKKSVTTLTSEVPFNEPRGIVLVEKTHADRKLYVIGCERKEIWQKRDTAPPRVFCALFILDVNDGCNCDVCASKR